MASIDAVYALISERTKSERVLGLDRNATSSVLAVFSWRCCCRLYT
jgi:hypothetical protein